MCKMVCKLTPTSDINKSRKRNKAYTNSIRIYFANVIREMERRLEEEDYQSRLLGSGLILPSNYDESSM